MSIFTSRPRIRGRQAEWSWWWRPDSCDHHTASILGALNV